MTTATENQETCDHDQRWMNNRGECVACAFDRIDEDEGGLSEEVMRYADCIMDAMEMIAKLKVRNKLLLALIVERGKE